MNIHDFGRLVDEQLSNEELAKRTNMSKYDCTRIAQGYRSSGSEWENIAVMLGDTSPKSIYALNFKKFMSESAQACLHRALANGHLSTEHTFWQEQIYQETLEASIHMDRENHLWMMHQTFEVDIEEPINMGEYMLLRMLAKSINESCDTYSIEYADNFKVPVREGCLL